MRESFLAGFGPDGGLAEIADRGSRAAESFDAPAAALAVGPVDDRRFELELPAPTRGPACLVALCPPDGVSDACEPDDPPGSAAANAGIDSAAAPKPNTTARAPTRPSELTRSRPPRSPRTRLIAPSYSLALVVSLRGRMVLTPSNHSLSGGSR